MKLFNALVLIAALLSTHAQAAGSSEAYFAAKYEKLPTPEMSVARWQGGGRLLGVGILQKNDPEGGFCRATHVVYPGAPYHHDCYHQGLTGENAQATYEQLEGPEYKVTFMEDGRDLLGSQWSEKTNRGQTLICVKTAPVVPNAEFSYNCYGEEMPVGGAISVGN